MEAQVDTAPIEKRADAEVGRAVHMLMWDRKVKQADLADRLGIQQSALSKKLRGHRPWGLDELIATAAFLQTTVGYLIGEVEKPDLRITERNLASVIEITEAPSRRMLAIAAGKSA